MPSIIKTVLNRNQAFVWLTLKWISGSKWQNSFDDFLSQLEVTTEDITYDMKDWISIHTLLQQIGQENPDTLEGLLEILQDTHPQLLLQVIAYTLEHIESEVLRSMIKERFAFIKDFLSAEFSSYPEYDHCRALLS